RNLVERADAIEDATRLDPPLQDVRQQLLDVRASRSGAAADRDVVEERLRRRRDLLVLRNTDAADRATRPGDAERRRHRQVMADALQHRVRAEAVRQLADALDRLLAAPADDVGRAEL